MVFAADDVERFVTDGFVVLREAFSPAVAAEGRAFITRLIDVPEHDPPGNLDFPAIAARLSADGIPADAYDQPMVHIKHAFGGPPFDRVMTSRLRAGLDQLMGEGRATTYELYGWWPVLFPGFPGPGGWHVDGVSQHHLTTRDRGLVTVLLFSDVGAGDGGTPLVVGSHATIARQIAATEPAGLSTDELTAALPAIEPTAVVSLTGHAGDVALLHPMLVHGFGPNTSRRLRIACNPAYPLREPMSLDRADGCYSPVEEAIRRAVSS